MKSIVAMVAFVTLAACVSPDRIGVLVSEERGPSSNGKFLYKCAYNVEGRVSGENTLVFDRPCPQRFNFEE